MELPELTERARSVARSLSYDAEKPVPVAKFLLLEMASRLDAQNIRAHKKQDGLMLVNGNGLTRFATVKERLAYALFRVLPTRI